VHLKCINYFFIYLYLYLVFRFKQFYDEYGVYLESRLSALLCYSISLSFIRYKIRIEKSN